jgi:PIN domain nuclease of toxin-antitoxin system
VIQLDTHALVWLRTSPDQLSRPAANAIRKALEDDCVAIAAITLWELSWLATTRRIDPGGTVTSFLEKITSGIVVLPLNSDIAAQAAAFPMDRYPKDPADRLIGATALVTGISLITKDDAIRKSQLLRTVW